MKGVNYCLIRRADHAREGKGSEYACFTRNDWRENENIQVVGA
jgi:hypothetical protein